MDDREPVVNEVIAAFGGLSAMARALGHKYASTVQGWQESGRIPPWRRHEVMEAAERSGVALPDGFKQQQDSAA